MSAADGDVAHHLYDCEVAGLRNVGDVIDQATPDAAPLLFAGDGEKRNAGDWAMLERWHDVPGEAADHSALVCHEHGLA